METDLSLIKHILQIEIVLMYDYETQHGMGNLDGIQCDI